MLHTLRQGRRTQPLAHGREMSKDFHQACSQEDTIMIMMPHGIIIHQYGYCMIIIIT